MCHTILRTRGGVNFRFLKPLCVTNAQSDSSDTKHRFGWIFFKRSLDDCLYALGSVYVRVLLSTSLPVNIIPIVYYSSYSNISNYSGTEVIYSKL